MRFNALGILDLVVAVSLGVLLGPSWLLGGTPSTEALTLLPLALVPTAAVPLMIALHLVSLRRLRAAGDRVEASPTAMWRPPGSPEAARS